MKTTIKQNGKDISLCFMNNKTFKELIDGKTDVELVNVADAIYNSALKVLDDSNKRYGVLTRQMSKMDENSVLYTVALRKLDKINETIENINNALDALENDSTEFHWIKYMIETCLGKIDAIETEE